MTLFTTETKQSYACNGSQRDFPVTLTFYAVADLRVLLRDTATGVETALLVEQDWQLIGAVGGSATVRSTVAPASGKTLTIQRSIAPTQAIDYAENDPFPAATHERALDIAAARDQDLGEGIARALRIAPSDSGSMLLPPAPARAGKALVFDGSGAAGVSPDPYVNQAALTAASATAAAGSAAAAAGSANTASSAATTAGTAAAVASSAATAASNAATTASGSATTATAAASNASTSATSASSSAATASTAGTSAGTSAAAAAGSASSAGSSATAAAASATAAGNARTAAEAARDLAQSYGQALAGTSTSSLTIAAGSQVLATQAGKAWTLGQRLRVASDDGAKVMDGEVTAYSGGGLTVAVDYTEGSGSHADWNISLTGARGPVGAGTSADLVSVTPTGNIAATDVQGALQELDNEKFAKTGGTVSSAVADALTVTYSDSGAAGGPHFISTRLSSSPASGDLLGSLRLEAMDSGGNVTVYARLRGIIEDPTNGSEDGGGELLSMRAGTEQVRWRWGDGLYAGGMSDTGSGRINVAGLDIGGVDLFARANNWNAQQSFGATASNPYMSIWTATNADNGTGRLLFDRVSPSPAANDGLFDLEVRGRDSAGNATQYVTLRTYISDPTDGSEDGVLQLFTAQAGVGTTTFLAGPGLVVGNASTPPAAGVINALADVQVAGTSISPIGRQTIWIPASAMIARTTSGPGSSIAESATNKVMEATLDFDAATAEYAQFHVAMPKSWNLGMVTASLFWRAANTGNVVWAIQAVGISNDDIVDAAFGTAQTVTDSVTATGDLMMTTETSGITVSGSPTAQDLVAFQVYRDAANGSDTCAVDARLIGVSVYFTTNAATDA